MVNDNFVQFSLLKRKLYRGNTKIISHVTYDVTFKVIRVLTFQPFKMGHNFELGT